MSDTCILFFLKYPELGKVKTRLAASVGTQKAMEAFKWMVETAWRGADSKKWKRQVCGTPDTRLDAFDQWLLGGEPAQAQSSGDLGKRLDSGVTHAFSAGYEKVICVGGDCVEIGADQYSALSDALAHNDVAILPADDGGYVAIGFSSPQSSIFQNIAWSTGSVLEETLEIAHSLGLTVWIGETLRDIDTFEDWKNAIESIYSDAPRLNAL